MPALIETLVIIVDRRLRTIGCKRPSLSVLKVLLETAYHSTLKTEEGRFSRSSISYMNPHVRPEDGPALRRADYPTPCPLARRVPLTVEELVRLGRAIHLWSGSIAVYGTKARDVYIWGVIDQLVQANIALHQEGPRGFENPAILTITAEGVGDLSVYHAGIFLCGLRGHRLRIRENDALRAETIGDRILPHLERPALAIARAIGSGDRPDLYSGKLFKAWGNVVSRLCIGLRRLSTGGSLLITPCPRWDHLEVGYRFSYKRLGDATILNVLDEEYRNLLRERVIAGRISGRVSYNLIHDAEAAQADAEDRETELIGAVKVVTSLASMDGLVLLSPILHVRGFGIKVGTGLPKGTIYDGADFERRGLKSRKIDGSRFGTRHNSVLRYCRLDREAVGIVVSQDGHVRIVASVGRGLTLWDNVKLLGYRPFTRGSVRMVRDWVQNHERVKRPRRGYTDTPKTLAALLRSLDDY